MGRELKVRRACGQDEGLHYEVHVDGRGLAIPAWMTQRDAAERVGLGQKPVCSLTSLFALKALLEERVT